MWVTKNQKICPFFEVSILKCNRLFSIIKPITNIEFKIMHHNMLSNKKCAFFTLVFCKIVNQNHYPNYEHVLPKTERKKKTLVRQNYDKTYIKTC